MENVRAKRKMKRANVEIKKKKIGIKRKRCSVDAIVIVYDTYYISKPTS